MKGIEMPAIVVGGKDHWLYLEHGAICKNIPLHIYKIMMGDDEIPGVLLSLLDLCSETFFFSDNDRLKVKEEINELIAKQLVTQEDMQEILKLLQFAIDNHRKVMITPFWSGNIAPSEND